VRVSISTPRVSVILPVHNGEEFLREAIDSVLAQSEQNLELIIIDDGSVDSSLQIAESVDDPRVSVVALEINVGLATALNIGISKASSLLIARQDQDDFSDPLRLQKQLDALDRDNDLVLIGTWATVIVQDSSNEWQPTGAHRHPSLDVLLRLRLLWNNPFVHSSVVFRKSAFDISGGYSSDPTLDWPEDYGLWSRMAHHGKLANLPELLVTYRHTPGGMSRKFADQIKSGVTKIAADNMSEASGFDRHDPNLIGLVLRLNSYAIKRSTLRSTLAQIRILLAATSQISASYAKVPKLEIFRLTTRLLVKSIMPKRI